MLEKIADILFIDMPNLSKLYIYARNVSNNIVGSSFISILIAFAAKDIIWLLVTAKLNEVGKCLS